MLKIVSAPNNVLSEKAKPVPLRQGYAGQAKIDKEVLHLIEEMKQTLDATRDPEGVGLAAPQVGKSLQLFIVKPTRKSKHQIFINPQIITLNTANNNTKDHEAKDQRESVQKSVEIPDNESTKLEGCLSLPSIWGEVNRADKVYLSYLDETGKEHKRWFDGFTATIIQHEYDHLQGELFPKRVLEQQGQLYKSKKNKKGEDVFEEIEI